MSRVGLKPIIVPAGVEVSVADGLVKVNGPKGHQEVRTPKGIAIKQENGTLSLTLDRPATRQLRSKHGLTRSLIDGAIIGVTEGYTKRLEVVGVGFRASVSGKTVTLKLGYSHDSVYQLPESVEASVDNNILTITGADKQLVGQVAAEIRKLRTPEPYKGKGIKYEDEYIIRKAGKAAGAAAKE